MKTVAISSHPNFKGKIPVYRGNIPRTNWDEILQLSDAGTSSKKIMELINAKYQTSYSEDSVRTVLRYIRNDKRRALDDTLVETVQQETQKNLERLESAYNKMESLVDSAIAEGDKKLAGFLADRLLKALSIKLSILKDTRDKTKGAPDQDSEQEIQELQEHVLKKLNLKGKKK